MHHDDAVRQARRTVRDTDGSAVAAAWLGSLSSRDLAARSAFGSYVVLQHLAEHDHTPSVFAGSDCGVCGLPPDDVTLMTEDELARRDYHWYPTNLVFSIPVLAGFRQRAGKPPTEDDHDRLRRILDAVRALPPTARLSDLIRVGSGIIPSNKHERWRLLETLGYAGILCPAGQPHYSDQFITDDFANSQYPERKSDWEYPIRFWTGAAGVNDRLVTRYFG